MLANPIIPSRIFITNEYPTREAPEGLSYYIHAQRLPSIDVFKESLREIVKATPAMAGMKTLDPMGMLGDLLWRQELNAGERDHVHCLGYNYVGRFFHHGVLIFDNQIEGCRCPLISAMAFNELLMYLDMINLHPQMQKWNSAWLNSRDEHHAELLLSSMSSMVAQTCNYFIDTRKFYKIGFMQQNHTIDIVFSDDLEFNNAVLTFDLDRGHNKWSVSDIASDYYKAACLLYPKMKGIVYDKVVIPPWCPSHREN